MDVFKNDIILYTSENKNPKNDFLRYICNRENVKDYIYDICKKYKKYAELEKPDAEETSVNNDIKNKVFMQATNDYGLAYIILHSDLIDRKTKNSIMCVTTNKDILLQGFSLNDLHDSIYKTIIKGFNIQTIDSLIESGLVSQDMLTYCVSNFDPETMPVSVFKFATDNNEICKLLDKINDEGLFENNHEIVEYICTNIINNKQQIKARYPKDNYVNILTKDKAFSMGCDYECIKNATPSMLEELSCMFSATANDFRDGKIDMGVLVKNMNICRKLICSDSTSLKTNFSDFVINSIYPILSKVENSKPIANALLLEVISNTSSDTTFWDAINIAKDNHVSELNFFIAVYKNTNLSSKYRFYIDFAQDIFYKKEDGSFPFANNNIVTEFAENIDKIITTNFGNAYPLNIQNVIEGFPAVLSAISLSANTPVAILEEIVKMAPFSITVIQAQFNLMLRKNGFVNEEINAILKPNLLKMRECTSFGVVLDEKHIEKIERILTDIVNAVSNKREIKFKFQDHLCNSFVSRFINVINEEYDMKKLAEKYPKYFSFKVDNNKKYMETFSVTDIFLKNPPKNLNKILDNFSEKELSTLKKSVFNQFFKLSTDEQLDCFVQVEKTYNIIDDLFLDKSGLNYKIEINDEKANTPDDDFEH